jgi:hypothetical protein
MIALDGENRKETIKKTRTRHSKGSLNTTSRNAKFQNLS